jgi:hypothetical protein
MGRMSGERAAMVAYEAWLAAALRQTERRVWPNRATATCRREAETDLTPEQRARVVLGRVLATLAAEAQIEAAIEAAGCDAWTGSR